MLKYFHIGFLGIRNPLCTDLPTTTTHKYRSTIEIDRSKSKMNRWMRWMFYGFEIGIFRRKVAEKFSHQFGLTDEENSVWRFVRIITYLSSLRTSLAQLARKKKIEEKIRKFRPITVTNEKNECHRNDYIS